MWEQVHFVGGQGELSSDSKAGGREGGGWGGGSGEVCVRCKGFGEEHGRK